MTQDTSIIQLSDIHFGSENAEALAWAKAEIERKDPALVLITGDLTMRARHREYDSARRWIAALSVPVKIEVGNHDLPYFNLIERFRYPYARFERLRRAIETLPQFPDLQLVSLLTTPPAQPRWPWSNGYIGDAALAETLAEIDAVPEGRTVVVSAHHPLLQKDKNGEQLTLGGDRALAELAKRGVSAVLSGHVHNAFDMVHKTAFGPIRMIGAGTLSTRLRSTPPGFNELLWDGNSLAVRHRQFNEN